MGVNLAVYFVCPLCGRQRPVRGWDPSFYADEITLRDGKGMGYGRGFEYSNERIADGSLIELDLAAMAKRCLEIVKICIETKAVSLHDLVNYVPDELIEEIVKEKAEDYGYVEE